MLKVIALHSGNSLETEEVTLEELQVFKVSFYTVRFLSDSLCASVITPYSLFFFLLLLLHSRSHQKSCHSSQYISVTVSLKPWLSSSTSMSPRCLWGEMIILILLSHLFWLFLIVSLYWYCEIFSVLFWLLQVPTPVTSMDISVKRVSWPECNFQLEFSLMPAVIFNVPNIPLFSSHHFE